MSRAPNPEVERELLFVGGPLNGQTRWQPRAIWPVGIHYPDPAGRVAGVWCGPSVPEDRTCGRYHLHPERPCWAEPLWMLWADGAEPEENVPEPFDPGDYCPTCDRPLSTCRAQVEGDHRGTDLL